MRVPVPHKRGQLLCHHCCCCMPTLPCRRVQRAHAGHCALRRDRHRDARQVASGHVWLACMLERRRTACTMGLALPGLAAIVSACRPSHASVHPSPILHPFAPADISSNNLLIREEKGDTCRLLLADPSITMRACDLAKPDMCARRLLLLAAAWATSTALQLLARTAVVPPFAAGLTASRPPGCGVPPPAATSASTPPPTRTA